MSDAKDAMSTAQEAVETQRPISATAGRNLLRIVKNDFEQIKQDLLLWRTAEYERVTKEVEAGSTEADRDALRRKAQALKDEYIAKARVLEEEARHMGAQIQNFSIASSIPANVVDVTVQGRVRRARAEVDSRYNEAYQLAEKEFLKCERLILLATVTGEAEKILSGIPSATELVSKAIEERRPQELTS